MKNQFKLFWQLLLFPLLYIPYNLLNQSVIVKWLGCSCPRLDKDGHLITHSFNANDFTTLFWSVLSIIVIGISIFSIRKIGKWYFKFLYLLLIALICLFFSFIFTKSMMWE